MTDRRLHPANARVAASHLQGQLNGVHFTDGFVQSVVRPVVDLCATPGGKRDRQLLLGAAVTVFEYFEGHAFVQAADGYVGYVAVAALGALTQPTHRVATFATHAYETESFKARDLVALPFGTRVSVTDERQKFFETDQGFIPKKHLRPLETPFADPATIAQIHFGVPYLWGGNSTRGIDCSGVIAAALRACDIPCPADSDMQRDGLGQAVTDTPQRGDLVFWKGHVAMMVDTETMIHANAHHMACVYEPLTQATIRIAAQGDGPVLVRKRLG